MTSTKRQPLLEALIPVAEGLAQAFGRSCEVVLHDYADPEHSVIAVSGSITGRRPGDPMSEIGRRVLAAGEDADNEINYLTETADGRRLKCSTFPLRDPDGELIGALCVNIDVTAITRAADLLTEMSGQPAPDARLPVTEFSSLEQKLEAQVSRWEFTHGRSVRALPRVERLDVVRDLRGSGLFAMRGAPGRVAERLGISRAGLYNDLAAVTEEEDDRAGAE